jgi:hypothetical protein
VYGLLRGVVAARVNWARPASHIDEGGTERGTTGGRVSMSFAGTDVGTFLPYGLATLIDANPPTARHPAP